MKIVVKEKAIKKRDQRKEKGETVVRKKELKKKLNKESTGTIVKKREQRKEYVEITVREKEIKKGQLGTVVKKREQRKEKVEGKKRDKDGTARDNRNWPVLSA